MPTTVGTEQHPADLIRHLLMLEHDAIAAYDSTIARLEDPQLRDKILSFRRDHESHLDDLHRIADETGVPRPEGGDMKQWLTTGKVAIASLAGDSAILAAMKTNEDDTVAAYEQSLNNPIVSDALRPVLEKGLSDERRHRAWMEASA